MVVCEQLNRPVEAGKNHAAQACGDLRRVGCGGLGEGVAQHGNSLKGGVHREIFALFFLESLCQIAHWAGLVGVATSHLVDGKAVRGLAKAVGVPCRFG